MISIILASSSIYRQELFSRFMLPFTTFSPDLDETRLQDEPVLEMVCRLAKAKARIAGEHFPGAICIGSDEVAAIGETIFGKPGNKENAQNQLQTMSGKVVHFHTAVCLYSQTRHFDICQVVTTGVKFRTLTEKMIHNYLEKEKPYHSAGSFKSETLGSALIERFEGEDPTAIVGLPLIALSDMLRKCGIEVV